MIKRLYVNNFRCLENFEIRLDEKPSTLLIGKNGAGKSTVGVVLEQLRSLVLGVNRVGEIWSVSDFSRNRTDIPLRIELDVVLQKQNYQFIVALEYPAGFKELRVLEESLIVEGHAVYKRERSQVTITRTGKEKEAAFLLDWHLVALPIIQEQSSTDPLYIFKAWVSRLLILSPIPSLIVGDSKGETLSPTKNLADFGKWFSGLLAHSPSAYSQIDKYLKQVLLDFKDVKNPIIGTDYRQLTVQFEQDGTTVTLPFGSLSDGEKCFFICALTLAANSSYGPVFCFWDEPDNFLAFAEVSHLILALRQSFQKNGQLIITSHNIETLRRFSDENTLLLYRRSHLEPTNVRPLSDLSLAGDLETSLLNGGFEL